MQNTWEHLSGSQSVGTKSNYTVPFPGGVQGHTLVIDSTDSNVHVFGGQGYDDTGNAGML